MENPGPLVALDVEMLLLAAAKIRGPPQKDPTWRSGVTILAPRKILRPAYGYGVACEQHIQISADFENPRGDLGGC